jgi:predicted component of type VI protein secretion system
MSTQTNSYPQRFAWTIDDAVIRLRRWGTGTFNELPSGMPLGSEELTLGSAGDCAIQVVDPWISRQHASLSYEDGRWVVTDLASRNGLKVDGVRVRAASLEPGMELRVGRTTLLAESMKSIGLHCLLARLLGWSMERRVAVDTAMRELRLAQIQRAPVVLRGEGDLVPVAHDLHLGIFGPAAPFVVCDPYRRTGGSSARAPANIEDGHEALTAAQGGTLCVRNDKPPRSFKDVLSRWKTDPSIAVQIILCDDESRKLRVEGEKTIAMPPLSTREEVERAHVVTEYAADAARDLRAPRTLTGEDQMWVLRHCGTSFSEIGKGVRRLLVLRQEDSLAGAARRLGMTHAALRRWFKDRVPIGLRPEMAEAIAAEPTELDS